MRHAAPPPRRAALIAGVALLAATARPALASPVPPAATPAAPPEVRAELPGAQLVGQGRLRWFGFLVYDARLWALQPLAGSDPAQLPLALELEYARRLAGRDIAERSIEEMRALGRFDDADAQRWLQQMAAIFPDVDRGDRITGVQRPGEAARFFVNARLAGEVRDAVFTRLFFGIWLAPGTSQPALRAALLGG
jgi:hypothetical protein